MSQNPMKLTQRLIDASRDLSAVTASEWTPPEQLADLQSRGTEVTRYRAGTILDPGQVEYLQCLRQRLWAFSGPAVDEWENAFAEAYRASSTL